MESQPVYRRRLRSVLPVAGNRMAEFLHVYTDLIFPSGLELDFQKSVAVAGLERRVPCEGNLPYRRIIGDIDYVLGVFGEKSADLPLGRLDFPLHDADILTPQDHVVPVVLQSLFGLDGLGEDHQAGGVLVKAVHNEEFVARVMGLDVFL